MSQYVLTNALLIDGTGAEPKQNHGLVIDGEKIHSVDVSGSLSAPAGAEVIDLEGKTTSFRTYTRTRTSPVAPGSAGGLNTTTTAGTEAGQALSGVPRPSRKPWASTRSKGAEDKLGPYYNTGNDKDALELALINRLQAILIRLTKAVLDKAGTDVQARIEQQELELNRRASARNDA